MTNYSKLFVIGRNVLAVIILLAIILILVDVKCGKKEPAEQSKKVEKIKATPPKRYVDDGGTTHTEKPVAQADISTIKASYQKMIDSLKQVLKIKDKQIVDLLSVGTTTTGKFKPTIDTFYIDSVPNVSVSYTDKWLSIFGLVGNDEEWKYTYSDSLTFTTYYKHTGFLKLGRTLMLDGFSSNPNTQIDGLTSIKINRNKPKKFALGFNISYAFDGKIWKPVAGVGLNYNIIRF
jgi:hypothetical protein